MRCLCLCTMANRILLLGLVLKEMIAEKTDFFFQEIPHHLFAIEFGTDLDGTQDFFQLFWPIVLSHRIDEASPLWEVSPMDLITEKFEIILTLEGTTPETGNNIQVIYRKLYVNISYISRTD